MVFEPCLLYTMVLGAHLGYPLEYSIIIFLGLSIWNSFVAWEESLVGVSLGILAGFMIGTGEGYLVGLSLGLPLGYPLDSPNSGAGIPGMLMGVPLGLWFGYEESRCLCSWLHLMDFHESNWWEVCISCVFPSGAFITSKINSVMYFQLMELLKLLTFTNLVDTYFWMEVNRCWTCFYYIHSIHTGYWWRYIYIYSWYFGLGQPLGSPCGMKLSHS